MSAPTSRAGGLPPTVGWAQKLVFVLVGLYVVQTILAFAAKDALVDAYVDHTGSHLPHDVVATGAPAYGVVAVIGLIVVGGVLLISALFFVKGASWARWVAVVFGVLGVLTGLVAFFQPSPAWYKLLLVVIGLVSLAIVVAMFARQTAGWFRGGAATRS